ncbi:hypothetical protein [Saliphagus sp. LR7]|uniref:hypothetical protein n=1 Tax=Saliphagus sp. LR7 TaxID=2282654 RepID=UPI000DF80409|nr:hypothetical protein [Saliphagus sp. LR7]
MSITGHPLRHPIRVSRERFDGVANARRQLQLTLIAAGAIMFTGALIVAVGASPPGLISFDQDNDSDSGPGVEVEGTNGTEEENPSVTDVESSDDNNGEDAGVSEDETPASTEAASGSDGESTGQSEGATDESSVDATPNQRDDGDGDESNDPESGETESNTLPADESDGGDDMINPAANDGVETTELRTLKIEATSSEAVQYEVGVSGQFTPTGSHRSGASTIEGPTAIGEVTQGSHTLTFDGDVTNLIVDGDAAVFVNKELVYVTNDEA